MHCWRVTITVGAKGPEQRTRVEYYTKRSEAREIARRYKGTVTRCTERHA